MADLEAIARQLDELGLSLRGGFSFLPNETAPQGVAGQARSLVLIGNIGGRFWPGFLHWRLQQPPELANPLDTWTRSVIAPIARQAGARALYPSDRPYHPFQTWAMRAEGLQQSPLGILMHPRFGVWHAYRAALAFDDDVQLPDQAIATHLCNACVDQPCRSACPVDAHAGASFAYGTCLDWANGAQSTCRGACLDRNACPYGTAFRYPPDMQAFIMAAFLKR